jgi:hypothetical protein
MSRRFQPRDGIRMVARVHRILPLLRLTGGASPGLASVEAALDDDALTATVTALEAKVFDDYIRCDLDAFARYFRSEGRVPS